MMETMTVANKPKFLKAWQQKDNMFENNYLQQHVTGQLKFIKDPNCDWITHDADTMNHL